MDQNMEVSLLPSPQCGGLGVVQVWLGSQKKETVAVHVVLVQKTLGMGKANPDWCADFCQGAAMQETCFLRDHMSQTSPRSLRPPVQHIHTQPSRLHKKIPQQSQKRPSIHLGHI